MGQELICLEGLDAIKVFTGNGLDDLLRSIEMEVEGIEPDISTASNRKEIASLAYKVSQSKIAIETAGKNLVADWKQRAKCVDASRKKSRDFLDALRDRVRQPLTDWEAAEEAKVAAAKLAAEIAEAEELACQENNLFDRQREIEAKEAELARQEADREKMELADSLERERLEREEQIRHEAAEVAKHEAKEKAQHERDEAARRILEEKDRADRAEHDRIAAAERAEQEKAEAVQQAKDEEASKARQKEDDRLRKEAAEKAEADRLASDKEHQREVNRAAIADIMTGGFNENQARAIIVRIATGRVRNVSIHY